MPKRSKKELKKRLSEIDEERRKIMQELGENIPFNFPLYGESGLGVPTSMISSPFSLQGRVTRATIQLIKKLKRPAASTEILNFVLEQGIDLRNNPPMLLAAILGQEVRKTHTKLKRVARGLYDVTEGNGKSKKGGTPIEGNQQRVP